MACPVWATDLMVENFQTFGRIWLDAFSYPRTFFRHAKHIYQWIGLRENLQETIDFPIFYMGFSCKFSLKPIH